MIQNPQEVTVIQTTAFLKQVQAKIKRYKIADGPEVSTSREDDQETVDTSVDINLDDIIHFKRVALVLDAGRSPNSSSKKQSPAKSEE